MKRSDATAALSWANDTRATSDTRITATEFRILCVIAGGCDTRAKIAAAAGCGESTVPRAVRRLEKIGALKRHPGEAGKANTYEVFVRAETGVAADTGITTSRVAKNTRISKVQERSDTGAVADTGSAVDNSAPLIRNASARVENKSSSIELELNSERVEPSSGGALVLTAPSAKPDKRGSRMHADWRPGPSAMREAFKHGIVNGWCEATLENFIDYWLSVPGAKGVKLDWDATFRNALRTEAKARRHVPAEYSTNGKTYDLQLAGAAEPNLRIRREPVSPATAARMQRRARREAERQPIDYGRVDSERIG